MANPKYGNPDRIQFNPDDGDFGIETLSVRAGRTARKKANTAAQCTLHLAMCSRAQKKLRLASRAKIKATFTRALPTQR